MLWRRSIWRKIRQFLPIVGEQFAAPSIKQILIDQEIRALHQQILKITPDNPTLAGFKVFSQVDEDGILEHIFLRIGILQHNFIEIGCGNGSENNTHYLALQGWQGVWVDGSSVNVDSILKLLPRDSSKLLVEQMFVTQENIVGAMKAWMTRFQGDLDLLSLDIDGNDALVLDKILTVTKPRVLVVEYNGKFPPPLKLSVTYNPTHGWTGDDYYGSSLQVFVDLLKEYRLVSCGVSGANAYFVRNDYADKFQNYTTEQLFMLARHHLIQLRRGGVSSLKFLKEKLKYSIS